MSFRPQPGEEIGPVIAEIPARPDDEVGQRGDIEEISKGTMEIFRNRSR